MSDHATAELVVTEKARRRRNRPEQALQKALFAHIDARSARGAFVFHPANGGLRSKIEARILKGLGVRAGVPDVIAIKSGHAVCLELKSERGRLSKAQQATIAALKAAGARVEGVNTLDDALAHLERWGILVGRVQ
jgi:hypothetical protein